MFFLPSDFARTSEEKEKVYFQIIEQVQKAVTIPIALKISYYFSNLGPMVQKLSNTGISGLVLFNRFFSPDFDIDNFEVKSSNVFSAPSDLPISLRWMMDLLLSFPHLFKRVYQAICGDIMGVDPSFIGQFRLNFLGQLFAEFNTPLVK
jgi:hypothetical protein